MPAERVIRDGETLLIRPEVGLALTRRAGVLRVAQRVAGESTFCVGSWISRVQSEGVLKCADGLLILTCGIVVRAGICSECRVRKMIKTTARVLFVALVPLAASAAISQKNQGQNNNNQGPVSAP